VSLAHLHGILREEIILVLDLTFYADESGIHDHHGGEKGSEVASIGGYIATKKQWARFEKRWNLTRAKFGIADVPFRMSTFYRNEPPYDTWSAKKRRRFLLDLIAVAHDNTTAAYASMVQTRAWDTILEDSMKLGFPKPDQYNPWHLCYLQFYRTLPRFLREKVDPLFDAQSTTEKIAFVFHQHDVFGLAAQIGFNVVKKFDSFGDRLGSITFDSNANYIPLQAADLLAFYSRRRFTRHLKGREPDEFELALLDNDQTYLMEYSPEQLKEMREHYLKVESSK